MSSAVSEVDAQSSSLAADAALVAAITGLHVTFRRNGRDVHALRGVPARTSRPPGLPGSVRSDWPPGICCPARCPTPWWPPASTSGP